jgi:hypothetical protein
MHKFSSNEDVVVADDIASRRHIAVSELGTCERACVRATRYSDRSRRLADLVVLRSASCTRGLVPEGPRVSRPSRPHKSGSNRQVQAGVSMVYDGAGLVTIPSWALPCPALHWRRP